MNLKLKRSGHQKLAGASSTAQHVCKKSHPLVLSLWARLFIALLAGCQAGPALYETSFTEYNNAVRKTLDEQMLANLVRMRYFESPIFLQVSSLNTSFSVGGNIGASGTYVNGGNNQAGASIGGTYSENPTISFSMPESREYYGRLLAPLSAKQVNSLVLGGFDTELVFRMSVRGINGLKNLNAEFDNSDQGAFIPREVSRNACPNHQTSLRGSHRSGTGRQGNILVQPCADGSDR